MSDSKECSICLEAFTKPKGLPCFHTFCQECLQMYINGYQKEIIKNPVNDRYFFCPMCRIKTKPRDPEKPLAEWAGSFPTNNYVLTSQQTHCPTHQNETLDIHCKTCKVMICSKCCFSTHKTCEKTLTKMDAKKIKTNLHAGLQRLKVQARHLDDRLGKLAEVKEFTSTKVRLLCEELATFISQQENQWLEEIETAHLKESDPLQKRKENINEIIENTQGNIDDMNSFIGDEEGGAKNLMTFDYRPKRSLMELDTDFDPSNMERVNFEINSTFVKIKDEILKENMLEKKIVEAPALPESGAVWDDFEKGHQVSSTLEDGTEDEAEHVEDETEEPKITNISESSVANTSVPQKCNASETSPIPQPLSFVQDVSFGSFRFFGVNDIVMLPDHCFLINLAYKKTLFKFSSTGKYVTERKYSDSEPFGLCLLEDNCVAVSQPQTKKVSIVHCESLTERDSFTFDKSYKGLASDDGEKLFCLYRDTQMFVDIVSKNNPQSTYQITHFIKLPSSIYTCDHYRLSALPSSGNIIIINSTNSLNVACFDQSGSTVFNYDGNSDEKLSSISDVAVCKDFIFVADKTANKIHRLQHDGSFVDVPLTADDNIFTPTKIFNNEGTLAILTNTKQDAKIKCFT